MAYGGNSVSMRCDTSDLEAYLDALGDACEEAVRPSAQAAAQVLYEHVRDSVPASKHGHWFYGSESKKAPPGEKKAKAYFFDAGTLRNSIYQVFSKDNSGVGFATYHISWNYKKCPYGFMVEYGTVDAPARPFIRTAVSQFDAAFKAAAAELIRRIEEVK